MLTLALGKKKLGAYEFVLLPGLSLMKWTTSPPWGSTR
jgi:hypothetical protein